MQTINPKFLHLSDLLISRFDNQEPIANTSHLTKMAASSGLQPGDDYTDFKTLYDIAEFAMNSYLGSILVPHQSIESIERLINNHLPLLCSETERSTAQSLLQQFSTPLNVAWLMNLLAGINQDTVLLEPSAGTGTLLTFRKFFQPHLTFANEISPLRLNLLKQLNLDHCFKEDAEMIHFMPKFHQLGINRIIMNPPFSRSHLQGTKKNPFSGAKHLISAYQLLPQSGRIVLLINDGFDTTSQPWKYFLKHVSDPHVPINASLDPKTFKKKGTTYPTRIIVIDKADDSAPLFTDSTIDLPKAINYLKTI